MMEQMTGKEIEIYSEKYDVHGKIKDYKIVTKLLFTYKGRKIVIGIKRKLMVNEKIEDVGLRIMESYISDLGRSQGELKLQLHYWHVAEHEISGVKYIIAHGRVSGHKKLYDTDYISTSSVQDIIVDMEAGEAVIKTKNSIYHCPLEYINLEKQDEFPDLIPDYQSVKERYGKGFSCPTIDPGKVLLVLSNFSNYYFHSLCYIPEGSETGKPLEYTAWPHVGMFQDSFLISVKETHIDLRYFPHFQNIEFYAERTEDKPLFVENIGDIVLYCKTSAGIIKVEPGQRKEVIEENIDNDPPYLPKGDLYPADII